MKRNKILNLLFFLYLNSSYLSASIGESVWRLAHQSTCPFIIMESLVDDLAMILETEFEGTFTVIGSLLDKQCMVNSKIDVTSSELDGADDQFADVQSALDDLDATVEIGFGSTFTTLQEFESKVCSVDVKVDDLDQDFDETFTAIQSIANKTVVVNSKVDALLGGSIVELTPTFTLLDTIIEKSCTVESKVDTLSVSLCEPTLITAAGAIGSAGSYCLANSISGSLTIVSDNVTLDLNGFEIDSSGTAAGIVLSAGVENITIKNGTITSSVSVNGITIDNGRGILIQKVDFRNVVSGISFFSNTQAMRIVDCSFTGCSTGMSGASSSNTIIKNCTIRNSSVGINFSTCSYCCIQYCEIFNISGIGIISLNGTGNLIEQCAVYGVTALAAEGIALVGVERHTIVRDSIIKTIIGNSTGRGIILRASGGTPEECILRKNTVSGVTAPGGAGIGVDVDSNMNLVIENIVYSNDINYGSGFAGASPPHIHTSGLTERIGLIRTLVNASL